MKIILPIVFAAIAAFGNAMFALGQKRSVGVENGLLFVGVSAMLAVCLALIGAPLIGSMDIVNLVKGNIKPILLSGFGLFFTYLGFNLLYSKFGASLYILYAVLSVISTTIIVGVIWLKEPVNIYHKIAIGVALISVILFSIGQAKT